MTDKAQVATRVMGLCLDRSGHLPDNDYAAMAVRGAVLVDLALAQRLGQTDDSIELDPTPTGWPPADRVLAELGVLDGRSLDWWLEHSGLRLGDVAAALVADGTWARLRPQALHRKPRYAPADPDALARDRDLLQHPDDAASPDDGAVVAIAAAAGLVREQAGEPTGPVAWVCHLVTDYVTRARIDGTAVSGASQTALWAGMPY